jgi:hypothetical protein
VSDQAPELEKSSVSPASIIRALNGGELVLLGVLLDRLFPKDELGPGALEIGVRDYIQGALSGPYVALVPAYRSALAAIDRTARDQSQQGFADLSPKRQDALIELLEQNRIAGAEGFFDMVWQHLREGLFCDPIHGGNQGMLGWKLIGFPGAQYGYAAEEQQLDVVIRREPRSVAQLRSGEGGGGTPDCAD